MVDTVKNPPSMPGVQGSPGTRPGSRLLRDVIEASPSSGRVIRGRRIAPYLLLVPSLAGIGLVLLWPTVQILLYSLQNFGEPQLIGTQPATWAGFSNFSAIFADPEFWLSMRITVVFAAVVVTLTLIAGTAVGLLLHRLGKKMATFVSVAALLAWATPQVSAAVVFEWMFNPDGGIVNWALSKMPHWLVGSTNWTQFNWDTAGALPAYTVITLLVVWASFPFIAITVLAGLKSVPAELYESARVDGAGPWQVFRKITYPLLKPIFLVLILLSVIWDFNIFTQTYILTGELSNRDEFSLGLYSYSQAFQVPPDIGLGSALALVLTVILLIITVGYVRASVKQGALT